MIHLTLLFRLGSSPGNPAPCLWGLRAFPALPGSLVQQISLIRKSNKCFHSFVTQILVRMMLNEFCKYNMQVQTHLYVQILCCWKSLGKLSVTCKYVIKMVNGNYNSITNNIYVMKAWHACIDWWFILVHQPIVTEKGCSCSNWDVHKVHWLQISIKVAQFIHT